MFKFSENNKKSSNSLLTAFMSVVAAVVIVFVVIRGYNVIGECNIESEDLDVHVAFGITQPVTDTYNTSDASNTIDELTPPSDSSYDTFAD